MGARAGKKTMCFLVLCSIQPLNKEKVGNRNDFNI